MGLSGPGQPETYSHSQSFHAVRPRPPNLLCPTRLIPGLTGRFTEGIPQFRSREFQALISTLNPCSMHAWTHLLVVLMAAGVGVANDQQVVQQLAAPASALAQGAYDNETNSTGNLIFWSVNSLLQNWPNTRYINGMVTFR